MDSFMILGIFLFLVGFIFIGIEAITPGFGVPGILGIACIIAGIALTCKTVEQTVVVTSIVLALLGIFILVIFALLSKGKIKTKIILEDNLDKENGYISSSDLQYLVGKQGVATTILHPAGKVLIEGVEFDVISDGRYINEGEKVEIYKISNSSLVVRTYD